MTSNEILAELVRLHEGVKGYTYTHLPPAFFAAMLQRGAEVREHVNTANTFLVASIDVTPIGSITCHASERATSLKDKADLGAKSITATSYPTIRSENGWVREVQP